jgi:hypothetical protein
MILVAGVASAADVYMTPNVVISASVDGLTVWVLVVNTSDVTTNQLYVNIANPGFDSDYNPLINADLADSYVYTLDGVRIGLALTDDDARFWDVATNYDGGIQRFWLPVDLQPHEYVVVKFVGTGVAPAIFDAQLGTLIPR